MSIETTRSYLETHTLTMSDGTWNVWLPVVELAAALDVIEAAKDEHYWFDFINVDGDDDSACHCGNRQYDVLPALDAFEALP